MYDKARKQLSYTTDICLVDHNTERMRAPAPARAATVSPPATTREAPLMAVVVAAAEAEEATLLVTEVGTTTALVTVVLAGMTVAPVPDVVLCPW